MADFGGNMALNIEQRLGQKLTNEQQILWNYMLQRWPNLNFTPVVFAGAIAGHEITVYSANKLYVCYYMIVNGFSAVVASGGQIQLMDETNAVMMEALNNIPVWDTTAAAMRYNINNIVLSLAWFSRINPTVISRFQFIGYRITI